MILFFFMPIDQSYPNAKQGRIYLSEQDFYQAKTLFLEGEWSFVFGEYLDAEGFDAKPKKQYYELPDYWGRDTKDGAEVNGYASYRLQIRFEQPKERVSLTMPWIFGAYKIFANGEQILECGHLGTENKREIADLRTKTADIPVYGDSLDLIIHVSGYQSGLSGLYHSIAMGTAEDIERYNIVRVMQDAFCIGCFFMMGFYHMALFFLRKNDRSAFYFSLLCFFGLIRQGVISYGLLYSYLPPNNGRLAYDIYILSGSCLIAGFTAFIYYLFGEKYKAKKEIVYWSFALLLLRILGESFWEYNFSEPLFYLLYLQLSVGIAYLFYHIYLIHKNKEKYRVLFYYGVFFLLSPNIIDILADFGFVRSNTVFGNGAFLIFTFIETMILARIYTDFYYEKESLLLNMEERVAERTEELADANDRLVLLEKRKNEFIRNISHDLRTPMTAIRGYMELLMQDDTQKSEEHQIYIESAHVRTRQMEKLIQDLFFLTRMTEEGICVYKTPLSVSDFLNESEKNYRTIARQKNLHIIKEDAAQTVTIHVDRDLLLRIMDNLMQNALHYAKTTIILSAKIEEDHVRISVIDDGEGIEKEDLPHIFDRFFKKRKDGTGLGLYIVQELALAMGAKPFANSIPDYRTELGVRFPMER